MRPKTQLLLLGLTLFMGACAAPQSLPAGPTPIPTLIPATEPASTIGVKTAPSFIILSYPAGLPSAAVRMTRAGFPTATDRAGIGRGTTAPAPTVVASPMSAMMIAPAPRNPIPLTI